MTGWLWWGNVGVKGGSELGMSPRFSFYATLAMQSVETWAQSGNIRGKQVWVQG